MNWSAECAAIIPCCNEARTIGEVVRLCADFLDRIYVVDDGSEDQTADAAEAAGAIVIRQGKNRGKGATIQRGLARAHADGFTWAVTVDGDGQHAPQDLPRFFEAAQEDSSLSLVIGNRMGTAERMPFVRRSVNRWMSVRLSNLAGMTLPDSQCGYRLIRLNDWAGMEFECEHFEFESEMLVKAARAGRRIQFVPITTIYAGEQSKIRPLGDTVRWFRWYARMLAGRPRWESALQVTSRRALEKGLVS